MSNNYEPEIAKVQEKIKTLKSIVVRAKEVREEIRLMFKDSGIDENGVCYWNLNDIDTQVEHRLNALRLSIAKLRGE